VADNKNRENCDLLFRYLKSILYDPEIKRPDLEKLEEPFTELGKELEVLQRMVEEMKAYSEALSRGNLSGEYPSEENFLCANLKRLHDNLNHLTWQAKQVAAGDYSQHVSYLGEFSKSFNLMIQQLQEREEQLVRETDIAQQNHRVAEEYNKLFTEMVRRRNEWILVVDEESHEILYCNRRGNEEEEHSCNSCNNRLDFLEELLYWKEPERYKVWEKRDKNHNFYRVSTFHIIWRGHNSYAHVVENITENKQVEKQLFNKAYYDAGTGLYNRFFFEEYTLKQLEEKKDMVLCYMDLDGLKYVNDVFGHNEGDCYISRFVEKISDSFRTTDAFARIGGDEFCMVLLNVSMPDIEKKMEQIRSEFIEQNEKPYPVSFSYGVVEVKGIENELSLEQIISRADKKMYEYKKKYKAARK
jgi:diguanylate cyclase (GGDEF) domain